MIQINTEADLSQGAWREFKPGVKARIRPCTRQDYRTIAKAAGPDGDSIDNLMAVLHHEVLEWTGIVDQHGQPLLCTPAMIDLVCELVTDFGQWVIETAAALRDSQVKVIEDDLKNSDASAGAPPTAPVEALEPVATAS